MSSLVKHAAHRRGRRLRMHPDPYPEHAAQLPLFRDCPDDTETSAFDLYGQCLAVLDGRWPIHHRYA